MNQGARRRWAPIVLVVSTLAATVPAARAEEPASPSVRLFATKKAVTLQRWGSGWVSLDLGTWVASVGGAFELRVSRSEYGSPLGVVQTDGETGAVVRDLPEDVLADWSGLDAFLRILVFDAGGKRVFKRNATFCPNSWGISRVDDSGPVEPRYPYGCWPHPYFGLGMVWGIDEGWAAPTLGEEEGAPTAKLAKGQYTGIVRIRNRFADLLGVAPGDAQVTLDVTVVGKKGSGKVAQGREADEREQMEASAPVPIVTDPDPATLPDLRPVPAWGMNVSRRKGRDYLAFAANEWNAGPAPLVVEGFRRPNEDIMDGYQYFYRDGTAEGRAPAGTLEYHAAAGHKHWHFEQFTEYTLLDGSRQATVASGKQSWCLVPTDAIDLSVEGATWRPWPFGLSTACGWADSIWVREVLQVGWGDTYYQSGPSQAFDITDLPNGRYFVRVEVNPEGALYERDHENNTSLRRIRLKGSPGSRRVVVPPYKGIDTEDEFFFGYFGA